MADIPFVTIDEATKVPFKFDGRVMYSSDTCEVIHLTLHPGEKMEVHSQPFKVVFYVMSGEGILHLGENTIHFLENTCIPVNTGVMRGWENASGTDLRLLVIKLIS